MSREEKINFLVWVIEEIEGAKVLADYFLYHTDEQLDNEVDRYEYLLEK